MLVIVTFPVYCSLCDGGMEGYEIMVRTRHSRMQCQRDILFAKKRRGNSYRRIIVQKHSRNNLINLDGKSSYQMNCLCLVPPVGIDEVQCIRSGYLAFEMDIGVERVSTEGAIVVTLAFLLEPPNHSRWSKLGWRAREERRKKDFIAVKDCQSFSFPSSVLLHSSSFFTLGSVGWIVDLPRSRSVQSLVNP